MQTRNLEKDPLERRPWGVEFDPRDTPSMRGMTSAEHTGSEASRYPEQGRVAGITAGLARRIDIDTAERRVCYTFAKFSSNTIFGSCSLK